MAPDPVESNPELYRVIAEDERVRVLEYRDMPGDRTKLHRHPESVMVTLSAFRRRLFSEAGQQDVEMGPGVTQLLSAREHYGENIGDTETHVIFVELKDPPGS